MNNDNNKNSSLSSSRPYPLRDVVGRRTLPTLSSQSFFLGTTTTRASSPMSFHDRKAFVLSLLEEALRIADDVLEDEEDYDKQDGDMSSSSSDTLS
eukprot:scaffold2222_cov164-Amphora_coffeaeformis.AAC.2